MGDGGSRFGGIAFLIGAVVVLNVLSHVFNWGWVFY